VVLAAFKPVRMAPGVNAIESVFIKACPDAVKISGRELWEEAGLERNAIYAQLIRASEKIFEAHGASRRLLLRIDFPEEAMIAVTVNSDVHAESPAGDNPC
jgi:hypothetical protein